MSFTSNFNSLPVCFQYAPYIHGNNIDSSNLLLYLTLYKFVCVFVLLGFWPLRKILLGLKHQTTSNYWFALTLQDLLGSSLRQLVYSLSHFGVTEQLLNLRISHMVASAQLQHLLQNREFILYRGATSWYKPTINTKVLTLKV